MSRYLWTLVFPTSNWVDTGSLDIVLVSHSGILLYCTTAHLTEAETCSRVFCMCCHGNIIVTLAGSSGQSRKSLIVD